MKKITVRALVNVGACYSQMELFRQKYPDGINVCWECFKEAQKKGIQVRWLSNFLAHPDKLGFPFIVWDSITNGWCLNDEGLKKMEEVFLKKRTIGDNGYNRRKTNARSIAKRKGAKRN